MKRISRGRRPVNRGSGPRNKFHGGSGRGNMDSDNSGPLMTKHLALHDLDLELALLKRKREIIEHQQQMLGTEQRFDGPSNYDFNQPHHSYNRPLYDEPQSNPTRGFAHLYDQPEPQFGNFPRQHGTKRPMTDEVWQSNLPPKRFGGSQKDKPRKPYGGRPEPFSKQDPFSEYGMLPQSNVRQRGLNMSMGQHSAIQPFSESAPSMGKNWTAPKNRGDFNPTMVTKPKTTSAPNKLDSYPPSQRKTLVGHVSKSAMKAKSYNEVLQADKPAPRQIVGRLELALGAIFKDVLESIDVHRNSLGSQTLRNMKQEIRDRIRSLMLGKVVGRPATTVAIYREKFPKETDHEIYKLATEIGEKSKPRVKDAADPDKHYIKANFNRLLNKKLKEMLNMLQKVYKNKEFNDKSLPEIIDRLWEDEIKIKSKISLKTEEPEAASVGNSETEAPENTGSENKEEANEKEQEDESLANTKTNESIANDTNKESSENSVTDETNQNVHEEKTNEGGCSNDGETDAPQKGEQLNGTDINDISMNADKFFVPRFSEGRKINFYNKLTSVLLNKALPRILLKFKEDIFNFLKSDEDIQALRASLIAETQEHANKWHKINAATEGETSSTNTTPQKKNMPKLLPYYVKIFGRPSLPKRKLMQNFLDQFNPGSIKKHKGIHNLLFVGFMNEDDFNNILAANNTVIGNNTIEVRISDRTKNFDNKKPGKSDDVITIDEPEKSHDLSSDLDNQIDNLLSSLRESEEKVVKLETNEPDTQNQDAEIVIENQKDSEIKMMAVDEQKMSEGTEEAVGPSIDENKTETVTNLEAVKDEVKETKSGTPTRMSTRLANAAPGSVTTRRASRLAQNNN